MGTGILILLSQGGRNMLPNQTAIGKREISKRPEFNKFKVGKVVGLNPNYNQKQYVEDDEDNAKFLDMDNSRIEVVLDDSTAPIFPYMVESGLNWMPEEGDIVLVGYLEGEQNDPIVTGVFRKKAMVWDFIRLEYEDGILIHKPSWRTRTIIDRDEHGNIINKEYVFEDEKEWSLVRIDKEGAVELQRNVWHDWPGNSKNKQIYIKLGANAELEIYKEFYYGGEKQAAVIGINDEGQMELKTSVDGKAAKITMMHPEEGNIDVITTDGVNFSKVALKPDGKIKIESTENVEIKSEEEDLAKIVLNADGLVVVEGEEIKLGEGALEAVAKGLLLKTQLLSHQHIGNLGIPAPISDPTHFDGILSEKVSTE